VSTASRPLEGKVDGVRLVWFHGQDAEVVMPTRGDPCPHVVERILTGDPRVSASPEAMLDRCLIRWMRDHYADAWRHA